MKYYVIEDYKGKFRVHKFEGNLLCLVLFIYLLFKEEYSVSNDTLKDVRRFVKDLIYTKDLFLITLEKAVKYIHKILSSDWFEFLTEKTLENKYEVVMINVLYKLDIDKKVELFSFNFITGNHAVVFGIEKMLDEKFKKFKIVESKIEIIDIESDMIENEIKLESDSIFELKKFESLKELM